MCFSAEVSFTAGAAISALGVVSLRKVKEPEHKLFAAIPLIFGLQQVTEGILWVTLKSGAHEQLTNISAHLYLVVAMVIWPVVVPLALWMMEEQKKRKTVLTGLLLAGIAVSLFYSFCLMSYNVTPQIQAFHIRYLQEFPWFPATIASLFYGASTILPFFVSSARRFDRCVVFCHRYILFTIPYLCLVLLCGGDKRGNLPHGERTRRQAGFGERRRRIVSCFRV
jgi:hypothetical protein